MKLLVVCQEGNNRSVTLAHQLKYLGHDVLTMGTKTNGHDTQSMLYHWADKIIITDRDQTVSHGLYHAGQPGTKIELWDIGPDVYPRPFNKELLKIVKTLIAQHRDELNTES